MKELIENVVQWGKDRGLDKVGHLAQAKYTLKETAELLDAYADDDQDKMDDAIGDILVTLIVGASNNSATLEEFTDVLINGKYRQYDYSESFMGQYTDLIDSCGVFMNDGHFGSADYIMVASSLNSITRYTRSAATLQNCLQLAYDEIKDRTGKMVNGQFIKD